MELHLSVSMHVLRPTIHVAGELDLVSAPDLESFAAVVMAQRGPMLTLDLSGVTFLDASGVAALLAVGVMTRSLGGELVVRGTGHRAPIALPKEGTPSA